MKKRQASLGPHRAVSAADAAHRALRRHKIRLADMVPLFFLPHDGLEIRGKFLVRLAVAETRAQVVFRDAEQAGADLAVGGQPQAIAMAAERLANGRNQADFAAPISKGPTYSSLGGIIRRQLTQFKTGFEPLQDFAAGHDQILLPGMRGIQWHELDEPERHVLLAREIRERLNLVVVDRADDDGVDLDG